MTARDSLRLLLDAANAEDTEGFLGAFADDAAVDDDGRLFRGLPQIAEWSVRAVIGVRARFRLLGSEEVPGGVEAVVEVGAQGRSDRRLLLARVRGERIASLVLRPGTGRSAPEPPGVASGTSLP